MYFLDYAGRKSKGKKRRTRKIDRRTTHSPEQLRITALANLLESSIGSDDLRFEEVVDADAVAGREE